MRQKIEPSISYPQRHHSQNHISLLLLLSAIFLLSASILSTNAVAEAETLSVKIGAYENHPKIFIDDRNQVSGFWPELIEYIAKQENWKIEYLRGSWSEGLDRLEKKEIDIMPDVAFTEKRDRLFTFSMAPVLMSWTRLYVNKENTEIKSIQDLENKKIAALKGSVNLEGIGGLRDILRGFNIHCTLIELGNYSEVFKAIEESRVDAGITNRNFGNKNAENFAVKKTPVIFQPINMKFAFPNDSRLTPLLAQRINHHVAQLIEDEDSLYYHLLKKYFEAGIAEKKIVVLPDWFKTALSGTAALLIFFTFVITVSRFQVRRKTRELREINKTLRRSEQRFQLALEGADLGLWDWDLQTNDIYFSPRYLSMLGYGSTELPHTLATWENLLHPDDKELAKQQILDSIGKGVGKWNLEFRLRNKNGQYIWILGRGKVVEFSREGSPLRAAGTHLDISERKRTEEALLKVRKLESVGILAGGIAHDFNNILAAILGNISFALMTTDPKDEIYELLLESEKASLRAKDLTQQLLTFAKGGEPVKKIAAIDEVIKDSADFVLRGSNVRCAFKFSAELWPVAVDMGQISQVIQNIIINASQAMPTGGIIAIDCSNYCLEPSAMIPLSSGEYIKIVIKDQGVGIPADMLDKIFDPYFTTKQKGSGLGLAITHSIISKHDGHIAVDSEPGQGTSFTIYLPASRNRPVHDQKDVVVSPVTGQGKVMIMDDEEMIRSLVERSLSSIGYEVVVAEDGDKAVRLYQEAMEAGAPIDLIIMDLTIPGGMGGKDIVKEIHKIDPEAKVIVSSGYSNDPVMANFSKYGFCAAMVKPFRMQELMEVVAKAVKN